MTKMSEKSSMNSRDQRYAVIAQNGSINIYFEKITFKETCRLILAV